MGYKLNGVESGGIPMRIVKALVNSDSITIPVLVETGTAAGDSIREAAPYFDTCHTIELIEDRQIRVGKSENIIWHVGHSPDILPQIISELNDALRSKPVATLFFLDAHYSGPEPTNDIECPLLQELEAISKYKGESVFIIDDARLFFGSQPWPLDPRKWPRIDEIFFALKKWFPNNLSTITDDYIISYPESARYAIEAEWRENYAIRYPDAETKLRSDARNVWNAIQDYLK